MQNMFNTSNRFCRSLRYGLMATLLMSTTLGTVGGSYVSQAYADEPIKPASPTEKIPDFVDLVKQVKPAVVSIISRIKVSSSNSPDMFDGPFSAPFPFSFPFPFPFSSTPQVKQLVEARGSGFLISSDGFVVTNNHVVKQATKVTVVLDDGTALPAKIIGRDSKTDLALLKVVSKTKLPYIDLGNSDNAQPGQWVIAVGNPYGLGGTVTAGIISARGRDLGDGPYDSFLQVDAPINKGNSGGPLFTQDGKVIGVNTAILSPSGGSIGIGFAIPSDVVRNVVDQIRKNGHVTRGYLGVSTQLITPSMAEALKMKGSGPGLSGKGALVASVSSDSPAEKGGIKAGDVITNLNGKAVNSPHDLAMQVAAIPPGTQTEITIVRNGKPSVLRLTITTQDENAINAENSDTQKLGVVLSVITPDLRQQLGLDMNVSGVVVTGIQPGSLADMAKIRPGDVLQSVGDTKLLNPKQASEIIYKALQKKNPILLRIIRDGQGVFVAIDPSQADKNETNDDEN